MSNFRKNSVTLPTANRNVRAVAEIPAQVIKTCFRGPPQNVLLKCTLNGKF